MNRPEVKSEKSNTLREVIIMNNLEPSLDSMIDLRATLREIVKKKPYLLNPNSPMNTVRKELKKTIELKV